MTVKELVDILKDIPPYYEVLYLHNKYGRIEVDTVETKVEHLLNDENYYTVTLSGAFEED